MRSSKELPRKCTECIKSSKPLIHSKCDLCKDLGFQEEILCDLNQYIQEPVNFICHAFQPMLNLVEAIAQESIPLSKTPQNDRSERFLRKLVSSDRIGYERALALQKLRRDQDAVFAELKYHLAWNVINRTPVFMRPAHMSGFISDVLSGYGELVGGFVSLLRLAPDHLHLYVESNEETSIEKIAQEMKHRSSSVILEEFGDLKASIGEGNELWDIAYFAETIG
jgi:REP element-mobilizing transposase RayT